MKELSEFGNYDYDFKRYEVKIAILNSYIFPVPAVRGGAVETLIESLIKEADKDISIDLTVFSLYDELALKESKKYPNVTFKWLKRPMYIDRIDRGITSFLRFIKRNKDLWQKNFLWQIINTHMMRKFLSSQDYDKVIIQNAIHICKLFESKEMEDKYRGKVYFHTHNIHFRKVKLSAAFAGILSISHFLEENIRKCFGSDIDIKVIHNGVNTDLFEVSISKDEDESLRAKYEIPAKAPLILFVGRIMPKKGVWELLQAFTQLKNTSAHLILVGSSSFGMDNMTSFEYDVAEFTCKHPQIHTVGFIHNNELGKYYAAADVVVLPSIWNEPLGLTMIEAQLSGTPLITTNKGGIPEITNVKNSILLEVTNTFTEDLAIAIDDVIDNPKIWKEKAKVARKEVKNRLSERVFYENMLNSLT